MEFEKRKIKISLNGLEYSLYYSCDDKATFQDLLEYFSFLVHSSNICQCYKFYSYKDKKTNNAQSFQISNNQKIIEFSDYLKNLIIQKYNNKCEHSNQNYMLYSKNYIANYYQNKIAQLYKQIEILQENKVMLNQPNNRKDFYDVIVNIDTIKGIKEGWKIDMTKNGKSNYDKFKNEKIIKIGVIGNDNKGKSFILSKISNMNLPTGTSIKTEGLSIKYPELKNYENRKIALIDSAGFETPVLATKEMQEGDKNKLYQDKCWDKIITELFLQNYIVYNSDILIVVVDCLSFSEQKLLEKVKQEVKRLNRNIPLYIIHNLKTYTSKEQVKDYLENTLLKSATFTLEKDEKITAKETKSGVIINSKNIESTFPFKFHEKDENKNNENIFHLIYANEDSEAGKYYNKSALGFIETSYQHIRNYEPYDVIETIKDRFIEVSKEIIEKIEKIEKKNFVVNDS